MPSRSLGDAVPNEQLGYEDSHLLPEACPVRLPRIYSDERHTEYVKVLTRNAKCDNCESRNTTCMQKCRKCGLTTCTRCYVKGELDSRHDLRGLDLDWGVNTSEDSEGGRKHRHPSAGPVPNDAAAAQSGIASRRFLVREKNMSSNDQFTGNALQKDMSSINPDQAASAGELNTPQGGKGMKTTPRRVRPNAASSCK
jgi:hypothetical protein